MAQSLKQLHLFAVEYLLDMNIYGTVAISTMVNDQQEDVKRDLGLQ